MEIYRFCVNLISFFVFLMGSVHKSKLKSANSHEERVQILRETTYFLVAGWILFFLANF